MLRNKIDNLLKKFERKFVVQNKILIFRDNLKHNLDLFRNLLPDKSVWIILKSNAYGHGISQISEICKDLNVEYLVVDGYFEALKVWKVSPKQKVLIIGYIDPLNLRNIDLEKVTLTIYDKTSIRELGKMRKKVKIHLKINTGMNRQGIEPDEIEDYLDEIRKHENIELEGVLSHFADADSSSNEFTEKQEQIFTVILDRIQEAGFNPKFVHLGATAGSLKTKDKRINAIRLGLGFYGYNPYEKKDEKFDLLKDLKPALRLESKIIKVRNLDVGEKVSYNLIHTITKKTKIGILPLGYYEGVPRELSNSGFVKSGEEYLPIIGRVCMNLTIVDLKNETLGVGSSVILVSEKKEDKVSVENICKVAKQIPHQFLVNLNENIRREIRD